MRKLAAVVCIGAALGVMSASAHADAAARGQKPRTSKPAPKRAPAPTPPPLTAAQLGLGDTKLSTLKAEENKTEPKADVYKPAEQPAAKPAEPAAPKPVELAAPSRDRVIEPSPLANRHFVVGFNPLPIIAGRYGVNVEVVPFVHHAFVATAFYQTFTPKVLEVLMPSRVDVSRGADAKIGGELGYRFYTGRTGAHGLFFGASGVAMPLALPRLTSDFRSEVVSFHAFGGAVDVGVQAITSFGLTIGGGFGAMYLAYEPPKSATPPPGAPTVNITTPHVLPRLLLSAGWSF